MYQPRMFSSEDLDDMERCRCRVCRRLLRSANEELPQALSEVAYMSERMEVLMDHLEMCHGEAAGSQPPSAPL